MRRIQHYCAPFDISKYSQKIQKRLKADGFAFNAKMSGVLRMLLETEVEVSFIYINKKKVILASY